MAAGLGAMEAMTPDLYEHLERLGDKIRKGLSGIFSELCMKAQVVGLSSIFHLFFIDERITDTEQVERSNTLLYLIFELGCLSKGVNLGKNHCSFLSSPMSDRDVEQTLEVMKEVLTNMVPVVKALAPSLLE
jgi:glutamate-1-semialdehyde 2,1-aminomutase